MRINKYVALATGMSRRAADAAIMEGRVKIKDTSAKLGDEVTDEIVTLDGKPITPVVKTTLIMLNKPVGYVCSRYGQGSKTIYNLLPPEYHRLKPVGRLDKDSSGLILLTDDGNLAQELTHPSNQKLKIYEVSLNKPLEPLHQQMVTDHGIQLEDGPSKLLLASKDDKKLDWEIKMSEGRNRQIRRTFAALGYKVTKLHRTRIGNYTLSTVQNGKIKIID